LRYTDLSLIGATMARLRATPPDDFASEDLLPGADVLRWTADGVRVIVRPSGTEPKLKAYLEVVEPVTDGLESARAAGKARLAQLRERVTALVS
jgi:phosphomannomutase